MNSQLVAEFLQLLVVQVHCISKQLEEPPPPLSFSASLFSASYSTSSILYSPLSIVDERMKLFFLFFSRSSVGCNNFLVCVCVGHSVDCRFPSPSGRFLSHTVPSRSSNRGDVERGEYYMRSSALHHFLSPFHIRSNEH